MSSFSSLPTHNRADSHLSRSLCGTGSRSQQGWWRKLWLLLSPLEAFLETWLCCCRWRFDRRELTGSPSTLSTETQWPARLMVGLAEIPGRRNKIGAVQSIFSCPHRLGAGQLHSSPLG